MPNAYGLVEYVINDSGVKEQGYLNSVKPNGVGEWEVIKFNNITRRSNEKLDINNGVIEITSINVLEVTSVDTSIPVAPIMGVLYKTVNSGSDVQLAWTTATDINGNLDGYNIYYKKSIDVNWTLFGISATLGTTVTGLTKNTNYDFRITAYDSGTPVLESLPSNITSILTIETTPPVIGTLSSSTPTETTIPLYWTAATSDIDIFLYKLYYKKSSDPIFVSYINIGNTILTYTVTGLDINTSYDFKLNATDTSGNISSYSNTITALTLNTGQTYYPHERSNGNLSANNACQDLPYKTCSSLDSILVLGSIIYNKPSVSDVLVGANLWYQISSKSYRVNNIGVIIDAQLCVI